MPQLEEKQRQLPHFKFMYRQLFLDLIFYKHYIFTCGYMLYFLNKCQGLKRLKLSKSILNSVTLLSVDSEGLPNWSNQLIALKSFSLLHLWLMVLFCFVFFAFSQVNTRLKQIWTVPIMLSEPNKFDLGHGSFLTG